VTFTELLPALTSEHKKNTKNRTRTRTRTRTKGKK